MYITLFCIVFFAAVTVFFSKEFFNLFKKFFAIPGVKLLFPLLLASWIVAYSESWIIWIFLWCKEWIHLGIYWVALQLPFSVGAVFIVHIFCLFLLTSVPLWVIYRIEKRQMIYDPPPHNYLVILFNWIVVTILLTIHQP